MVTRMPTRTSTLLSATDPSRPPALTESALAGVVLLIGLVVLGGVTSALASGSVLSGLLVALTLSLTAPLLAKLL